MIPRYSRPEMTAIWSPETKFRIWFEIEAHACDALADLGVIPKDAAKTIWDKGGAATFDIERIDAIERETKHDVIAFLTHLAEIVGWVGGTLTQTEWNIAPEGGPAYQSPALTSRDEILALFDSNLAEARKAIEAVDESELDVMWQLKHGEQVLFNLPRRAVIRTFVINHLIHHRAHLSLYLRLNEVKVPFMYGG